MDKREVNNIVSVTGTIVSGLTFNHTAYGERFYLLSLRVERKSEKSDTLPIMLSERLLNVNKDYMGSIVRVNGQFRSYNRHEEGVSRLMLVVFAQNVEFFPPGIDTCNNNYAQLNGYICKPPTYRTTPLGWEISDVVLAVNRSRGKSDYIPCVFWGRNARFVSDLNVGTNLMVWGRLQSREYIKKLEDETVEPRTAFELSVSDMGVICE